MGHSSGNDLKMNYFVTVLLTVSSVYSYSVFDDEGDKGLCLDPMVTYSVCSAGSNLEMKVPAALEACSNVETRNGKHQTLRQSRNYDESCPSFDEIMGYLSEEFGMEACILQNIGWLDENMNKVEETINEDMNSLMPEFSALISEEEISGCVADTLQEVGMGITNYKCFERTFDNACNDFVYTNYVE